MNRFLSLIYLIVIFVLYNAFGHLLLKTFDYKKENYAKRVVAGFIGFYFVQFIFGFICQNFHTSWNFYFIGMSIVNAIIIVLSIYFSRKEIIEYKDVFKKNWKQIILQHITNYWFMYLMVGLLSILSMSNQLSYVEQNYDDLYYIGKMVKHVGSPALFTNNYYSGRLETNVAFDPVRFVNTFELTYSYLATMFHIYIPYFARGSMVVHNYIVIFLAYIGVAKIYIKKESIAQFSLVGFSIFFIASGYLMTEFSIISYDGWQFQTAIFYGGSMVRIGGIPILFLFGYPMLDKIKLKNMMFVIIICITMLSLSTITIQMVCLICIAVLFAKGVTSIQYKGNFKDNIRTNFIAILYIFITLLILYVSRRLTILIPSLITDAFNTNYMDYNGFFVNDVLNDQILIIGSIVTMLSLIIFRKREYTGMICIVMVLFGIFYSNKFLQLIHITSFNYYFVSLRTITAIQMMFVFIVGLTLVYILSFINYKSLVIPVLALSMVGGCFNYVVENVDEITKNEFLASGVTRNGYDWNRVLDDDYLINDVYLDIGNYFNSLPYRNYNLYTKLRYDIGINKVIFKAITTASNRIQYLGSDIDPIMIEKERKNMDAYLDGKLAFDNIKDLILKYKIEYLLVYNQKVKKDLSNRNYSIVVTNKNHRKEYNLIKLS